MITKEYMIIYQGIPGYRPGKQLSQDLISASATDRGPLPHSVSMLEPSEDTTGSTEPVRPWPSRSEPHEAPSREGQPSPVTILVVDDEAPVRETLTEILGLYGYRVITAASVEEAEDAKQRVGVAAIHLVIADIHLTREPQERAGYALAQRWRAMHLGLPFILMSGDRSNEDLPDVRAGTLRFLPKPFAIDVLIGAVRDALGS
jgi:CheY-like chemotaxis protein